MHPDVKHHLGKCEIWCKAVSATHAQNTANKVDKKFEVVDCNSLARSDFYMGHGVWEPLEHSVTAQNIMDQMTCQTDDRPCFGRGRELFLQLHDTVMEYRSTDVTGNLLAPEGVVRNVFDNVAGIRDTEDTQSVQRCLLVLDQLQVQECGAKVNYSSLVEIVPHLVLWLRGCMQTFVAILVGWTSSLKCQRVPADERKK